MNPRHSAKSSLKWPTLAVQFDDISADIDQPKAHVCNRNRPFECAAAAVRMRRLRPLLDMGRLGYYAFRSLIAMVEVWPSAGGATITAAAQHPKS
eukprot:scaffold248385_cov69-Cyclotella_meneghiniana.AAC.4